MDADAIFRDLLIAVVAVSVCLFTTGVFVGWLIWA